MNTIITIGRQFGSAGREIGEKVAEYFGIKCYDKELLTRAAKESGFCEEMIKNHDERPTNSFLYNLVMDTYSFGYNASSFVDMPISHKVFLAQFDTIKKIASEGPCIIVGRCADYALSEFSNCVHLFIYGESDTKTKRIMISHVTNNFIRHKVRLSNGLIGQIVLINKFNLTRPLIQIGNSFIDLSVRKDIGIQEILD